MITSQIKCAKHRIIKIHKNRLKSPKTNTDRKTHNNQNKRGIITQRKQKIHYSKDIVTDSRTNKDKNKAESNLDP